MAEIKITIEDQEPGIKLMPLLVNITSGDDFSVRTYIKPIKSNDYLHSNNQIILRQGVKERFYMSFSDNRTRLGIMKRFNFKSVKIKVEMIDGFDRHELPIEIPS